LSNYEGCIGDTAIAGFVVEGASWVGALSMAGNVSEWVADWYGPYTSNAQTDPIGPKSGEARVVRGLALGLDPRLIPVAMRSTVRASGDPGVGERYRGFRIALPVQ
jgi:formylglycine-generating enzyme required for sulfatase activity